MRVLFLVPLARLGLSEAASRNKEEPEARHSPLDAVHGDVNAVPSVPSDPSGGGQQQHVDVCKCVDAGTSLLVSAQPFPHTVQADCLLWHSPHRSVARLIGSDGCVALPHDTSDPGTACLAQTVPVVVDAAKAAFDVRRGARSLITYAMSDLEGRIWP